MTTATLDIYTLSLHDALPILARPRGCGPGSQPDAFSGGTLQHADWVAQRQVLQLEDSARTEDRGQGGEKCRERKEHRRRETIQEVYFPPAQTFREAPISLPKYPPISNNSKANEKHRKKDGFLWRRRVPASW